MNTGTSRMSDVGRGYRLRVGLALASASALIIAGPAHAQADPFGIMKSVAGSLPSSKPKPTPNRTSPTPAESGAMGMREGAGLPPLRRLGTDAVAVVEAASANAPVRPMDYVFAGQTLALGPSGRLTMSYLSGCLTEVIQGGTVTVALGGSKVAGGRRQERVTPGCRATKPVILSSASEAGATVNRVTPFTTANWNERALKSSSPMFKWEGGAGAITVRVRSLDEAGEPVIWQTETAQGWIAYPSTATKLVAGAPYRVEASSAGAVFATALFSIDPALDIADSVANRIVPLAKP